MISSISGTVSALQALGTKMAVSANNVANVESDAFKKSRAVLEEGERNEVTVDIEKIDTPGPVITEFQGDKEVERELSNVDLGEELPHSMSTQRSYEANLKVLQTQDEMLQSVIDIKG